MEIACVYMGECKRRRLQFSSGPSGLVSAHQVSILQSQFKWFREPS